MLKLRIKSPVFQALVFTASFMLLPVTGLAKQPAVLAPTSTVADLQEVLEIEVTGHPALAETYQQRIVEPVRHPGYIWRVEPEGMGILPLNFRTVRDPLKRAAWKPGTTGLTGLRLSGSANPVPGQMKALVRELRKNAGSGPIYIVDLRQESHGYFNDKSVSWYGKDNWANVGLTTEAVLKDEGKRLALTQGKTVKTTEFAGGKAVNAGSMLVTAPLTEAVVVKAAGARYVRFTLTDQVAPNPEQVDAFLKFYKNLPQDAWVHFHCQAGMGRTTTFMTMVDIINNAAMVPVEDIAARQYLLNGSNLLGDTGAPGDDWHGSAKLDRARFIKYFYDYVQKYPKLNKSWSSWYAGQMAVAKK